MLDFGTNNVLGVNKLIMLGVVFMLLGAVSFCGYFQTVNHFATAAGFECNKTVFMANYNSPRDNLILSLFLLFSIASTVLIKSIIDRRRHFDIYLFPPLIFLKVAQFVFKLYNPILKAFRQGMLHPQIY